MATMTIFPVFAAAFLVPFVWLILRHENRSEDVGFVRKFAIRTSLLVFGLSLLMLPFLLKFAAAGPLVPAVILLIAISSCSSVVTVQLIQMASRSKQAWPAQKYWYIVLTLSVLFAAVSTVGVFLSHGVSV